MMTEDVLALAPGDSIMGLWDDWTDEFAIVAVRPAQQDRQGRTLREVTVVVRRTHQIAIVVDNGPEIRSASRPSILPEPAL
jgi:hypothetical protein